MKEDELYLRPGVMAEPLINHWYAWSHLLSPATAAMNVCERHRKIMQSYIQAPQVHAAAVNNPAMLGGPFIDHGGGRVDEVKELLAKTDREQGQLIALCKAIRELDDLLKREAGGSSLEPLYPQVPELLRGFVELVYDLNGHPSFRFVEALLYRSPFYDVSTQSVLLSLIKGDDRPFVLSTPRLPAPGDVHLRIPFADAAIDNLFAMSRRPASFSAIKDSLGVDHSMDAAFRELFTPEAPTPYSPYQGSRARWRYFGHACILVETDTLAILLDPVLSYTYESSISRYTYADLPGVIDYVLITHNHQDHILLETLLQLRHKIRNIVVPRNGHGALQDPSLRLMLQNIGFRNVIELDEMEEIKTSAGLIIGLPFLGEHADLNIRTKLAYRVEINGHTLLFAADSCNIEPQLYQHIRKLLGKVDVLFLGMECEGAPLTWLYGPLLTQPVDRKKDHSRRLSGSNFEQAMDIVTAFNCKEVYVYAMGQEPWLNYVTSKKYSESSLPIVASNRLIAECRKQGIVSERLFGENEMFLT
jgi:L-ascorbate metabolism protein UlaG (beta-lactamase superfamily)